MLQLLLLFAEESAPAPAKPQPTPDGSILWLGLGLMMLFYFIVLRPGIKRRDAEQKALRENMKKNDKVLTIAGIYGTVVAISDTENEVTVKVDDNVRLRMTKESILRNLTNEEAARAAKEAKTSGTT